MKSAVIKTGGKQYRVKVGDKLKIEKLPESARDGEKVTFDEVLLVADEKAQIGTPTVAGAKVEAKVVTDGRHDKVTVIKFKNKIRYRKVYGHRQPFTQVEITSIK